MLGRGPPESPQRETGVPWPEHVLGGVGGHTAEEGWGESLNERLLSPTPFSVQSRGPGLAHRRGFGNIHQVKFINIHIYVRVNMNGKRD